MTKTLRHGLMVSAFLLTPSLASAQCYQNGLVCGQATSTAPGTAVPVNGTVVMGTDGNVTIPLSTDTNGKLNTIVSSLPALPTGTNSIGSVTVNGTLPVSQSGTWNIGLAAGSNTIGSIANTGFNVTGSLPSFASTQTFNLGTAPTLTTNAQGAVTTAAPSYTSGNAANLSLTTVGALRVDGSGVTQPVSGSVTANIGTTNGLALDASVTAVKTALGSPFQAGGSIANTSFSSTQSGTWNVGISAGTNAIGTVGVSSLPALPTGSNTIGTVNVGTMPNVNVVNLAGTATMGNLLRTIAYSESAASLAASGSVTGTARDAGVLGTANPYNYFTCFSASNVAGTLTAAGSNDGSTFFTMSTTAASANVGTSLSVRIVTRYFRCSYTNGTTAQTTFFLNSQLGQ